VLFSKMRFISISVLACMMSVVEGAPAKPNFSWATVPLYQHLATVNSTLSSEYPAARAAWLAARFPIVVIEHAQGQGPYIYTPPNGPNSTWGPDPYIPPTGYFEEHAMAAARALKALNSSTVVLYYQQITGALPFYRASGAIAAHPNWRLDDSCHPPTLGELHAPPQYSDMLPNYVTWAYDHLQEGVTENFVANFLNLTAHSQLDGTFIDTAFCYNAPGQAAASLATVVAMQAAAPDKWVGFHTESFLAGSNGFSAAMIYTLAAPGKKSSGSGRVGGRALQKPSKDLSGAAAVAWMQNNTEAGVLSLCHIGALDQDADYTYALAVFLAGASNLTYFAFSDNYKGTSTPAWEDCWDGGSPTAPVYPTWCSGQGWSADFDRPL
jgi:hypothetical protein